MDQFNIHEALRKRKKKKSKEINRLKETENKMPIVSKERKHTCR